MAIGCANPRINMEKQYTAETNALAVITRIYDEQGRDAGYDLEIPGYAAPLFSVRHCYDEFGRVASVSSAAPALAFGVSYLPGTAMVSGMTNTAGAERAISFEPSRNLITAVSNLWIESPVAVFAYGSDALGKRVSRNADTFGYNARSEVTGEAGGLDVRAYSYDAVGNRVWSADNAATNLYAANALNQYTNVTGGAAVSPAYDPDGNLTGCTLPDGVWRFFWDAENRLAAAERLTFDAAGFRIRVRNVYDHRSRRVAKQLQRRYYREDGGMLLDEIRWGFPAASARRVWDGWNIVAETAADAVAGTTNAACYRQEAANTPRTLEGHGQIQPPNIMVCKRVRRVKLASNFSGQI